MRTVFSICFLATSLGLFSQTSDSSFNYMNDKIFTSIFNAIPLGWTFTASKGELVFEKTDSVYIAEKAKLGIAPNKKISKDSVQKFGFKTKARLVLNYSPHWTTAQLKAASNKNDSLSKIIKALPTKYKITSLLDKSKSTRTENVYTGKTEADKQLIMQYEQEKNTLMVQKIKIPSYHTTFYSYFVASKTGVNDEKVSVFPDETSIEINKIITLFYELSEKIFFYK